MSVGQEHNPAWLRELSILVRHGDTLRHVCKLAFSRGDASIYLIPYAASGRYYFGTERLEEHEASRTFDYTEQSVADYAPKISIHESGRVHVRVGTEQAGPLIIPPLASLRGQHVATICPDAFEGLPVFHGVPRETGAVREHVIPAEDPVANGRLVIYVNGERPQFVYRCRLSIAVRPAERLGRLWVGIAPVAQEPLSTGPRSGVTVIAGWDPTGKANGPRGFLYLRGE